MLDYFTDSHIEYDDGPQPPPADWTTADGRQVPFRELDDRHLGNCITMLERRALLDHGNAVLHELRAERTRRAREGVVVPKKYGKIHMLRVDRLLEIYNPYPHLLQQDCARILNGVGVEPDYQRQQTPEWHAGRVRHLAELLLDPEYEPEPIVVNGTKMVILDGHHRVLAASIAGVDLVPGEYHGDPATLAWLTEAQGARPAALSCSEREELETLRADMATVHETMTVLATETKKIRVMEYDGRGRRATMDCDDWDRLRRAILMAAGMSS